MKFNILTNKFRAKKNNRVQIDDNFAINFSVARSNLLRGLKICHFRNALFQGVFFPTRKRSNFSFL